MTDDHEKNFSDSDSQLINQIEQLKLPKRMDRRRKVYLGERVSCLLEYQNDSNAVEVIDLSLGGLAIVDTSGTGSFPRVVGQKFVLVFSHKKANEFKVSTEVSNLSKVTIGGREYERVGLRFAIEYCKSAREFELAIKKKVIGSHYAIRPQAFFKDPFFFNEIVIFQVNGFSESGVDLSVSARCKTLIPHQIFDIDFYFPGRGRFLVAVVNSNLHFRDGPDRYRIYVSFKNAERKFLEVLSEYLVTFSSQTSPNELRGYGFSVGDLSLAYEQSYSSVGSNFIDENQLKESYLSPPLREIGEDKAADHLTRPLTCKLGSTVVATAGLVFCLGERSESKLLDAGHQLADKFVTKKFIEMTDLYVSPSSNLVDFLLPLLRNCIRIGLQAQAGFLVLECSGQLKPILEKLGFRYQNSERRSKDENSKEIVYFLMSIDLKKVLLKKDKIVSEAIWKQVYRDLYQFFKKQVHEKKQIEAT